jgi:hypothetical protein
MKAMRHENDALAASAATASMAGTTKITPRPAADPTVLLRQSVFVEALRQTQPLAAANTCEASEIAKVVVRDTARARGLTEKVAMQKVTQGRSLESLISGANPKGTMAEVVAAHDYRKLHGAEPNGIINPPKHVASNVVDIRLSPDHAARKDLIFAFKKNDGRVLFKHNGQVKNGGTQYVTNTLVDMANTPDYGKVGYVDAKLVNADGSPKVGPGTFTEVQAQKLKAAKVRLRGILDLEQRAKDLEQDIRAARKDGLTPKARHEIETFRADISNAYSADGVARRMGGASAAAAASAAVISLVVQLATEGKVDVTALGKATATGAVVAAASSALDSGLYHAGTRLLDMAPEMAKEVAGQTIAAGFCLLAVRTDLVAEAKALENGEITVESAIAGASVKTALDVLPLVMTPLGLVGLPVLVVAQLGGRYLVAKARAADGQLQLAIDEDLKAAADLEARMDGFSAKVTEIEADCDETDRLFAQTLGLPSPADMESMNTPKPNVRLVTA